MNKYNDAKHSLNNQIIVTTHCDQSTAVRLIK